MSTTAVLRAGERSEAVRDLQTRLAAIGYPAHGDAVGCFGAATAAAVRSFQEKRRLRVDGICGPQTWGALVESGFGLGDRMLYLRRPMLRGDDVGALQRQLNALGFDAGREDGIFGDETHDALVDFQRNTALAVDGICGPSALAALARVATMADGSIASVREREALRAGPRTLKGRRIAVLVVPELAGLGDGLQRELTELGADVLLDSSGGDDRALAQVANAYAADACLALRAGPAWHLTYFEGTRYRSEAGYELARAIETEFSSLGLSGPASEGKTYPLLRETRMAAVIAEIPAEAFGDLTARGAVFATGAATALRSVFESDR